MPKNLLASNPYLIHRLLSLSKGAREASNDPAFDCYALRPRWSAELSSLLNVDVWSFAGIVVVSVSAP